MEEKLNLLDQALQKYVRPETFPLAVRMAKPGESIPERAKRPFRDLRVKISTCMGYTMARRYGWSVALGHEDISCPLSKVVYGFEPEVEYYSSGCTCEGMYTETAEAGARTEASTSKFSWREYQAIVCAPLSRTEFLPQVILIYGNSAQIMLLVIASLYKEGGRIESSFAGRIDCSDSVIQTIQSGKPQVILPCYGDRVFGQTQDHEMGFAFPYDLAPAIIEGLEGAYKGGVRYPIPTYLRFQPTYPPGYQKLEDIWAGEQPGPSSPKPKSS
jgi:uncharacterized protein (DUF169 family)